MTARLAAILIVALALPARAQGQDASPEAVAAFERGQVHYDKRRYREAIAEWQVAYQLTGADRLLFNLGQAMRLAGDCTGALSHYRKFIDRVPESADAKLAKQLAVDMEACVARDADSTSRQSSVEPGTSAATGSRALRIGGTVLAGAGLISIAGGVYFSVRTQSREREVNESCTDGCDWSDVEATDDGGRRAETLQWVFYTAGAVTIVAGVALVYLGRKHDDSGPSLAVSGDGIVTSWYGRF